MTMVVFGILVLGVLSLLRLPLEFMPSFQNSNVSVYAPYNSSSPEEVSRLIVRPLEDILSTINGVKRLSARASANDASIDLEFNEGVDMDLAAVEVRDRVDRVRNDLPDDLERVFIRRFQSSDIPVLRMNLSAPWEGERLFEFVEDVMRRRLERLEGVANVEVYGLLTPQLRVDLLPQRMAAHGIDVRTVILALQNGNVSLAGGYVREGSRKLLVRVMGELDSVDQIKRLPLGKSGIRIEDVAEVVYDLPERYDFNYLNGEQSVSMSINKASNANLLAVVEAVKTELQAIQRLPEAEGLAIQMPWDASNDVKKGLNELYKSGAIGGILAVVFMLFFLKRFRMTLLIGLAIPLSLVLTFVIMYFYRLAKLGDISINIMSLMGLMLSVGMLVDNSIVVIEAIVRRRQNLAEDAKTATLRGASEVAMPIICSTLTNICVFVPMVFLQEQRRHVHRLHEEHGTHHHDRDGRIAAGVAHRGADGGGDPAARLEDRADTPSSIESTGSTAGRSSSRSTIDWCSRSWWSSCCGGRSGCSWASSARSRPPRSNGRSRCRSRPRATTRSTRSTLCSSGSTRSSTATARSSRSPTSATATAARARDSDRSTAATTASRSSCCRKSSRSYRRSRSATGSSRCCR